MSGECINSRGDANWALEYPGDRLLPLMGTITDGEHLTVNSSDVSFVPRYK